MPIVVNMGTGPVEDATERNALNNIVAFVEDLSLTYKLPVTFEPSSPMEERDGRFLYFVTIIDGDISYTWDVEMPGLPLGKVRWLGKESGHISEFPRLYIDGSNWIWHFALGVMNPEDKEDG